MRVRERLALTVRPGVVRGLHAMCGALFVQSVVRLRGDRTQAAFRVMASTATPARQLSSPRCRSGRC